MAGTEWQDTRERLLGQSIKWQAQRYAGRDAVSPASHQEAVVGIPGTNDSFNGSPSNNLEIVLHYYYGGYVVIQGINPPSVPDTALTGRAIINNDCFSTVRVPSVAIGARLVSTASCSLLLLASKMPSQGDILPSYGSFCSHWKGHHEAAPKALRAPFLCLFSTEIKCSERRCSID